MASLGMPPGDVKRLEELLRDHHLRFHHHRSFMAITALHLAAVDLFVVGPAVEHPVEVIQRLQRRRRGVPMLLLVPSDRVGRIRRRLSTAALVPRDVAVRSTEELERNPAAVRRDVARLQRTGAMARRLASARGEGDKNGPRI